MATFSLILSQSLPLEARELQCRFEADLNGDGAVVGFDLGRHPVKLHGAENTVGTMVYESGGGLSRWENVDP